jgi:hypothetical protein
LKQLCYHDDFLHSSQVSISFINIGSDRYCHTHTLSHTHYHTHTHTHKHTHTHYHTITHTITLSHTHTHTITHYHTITLSHYHTHYHKNTNKQIRYWLWLYCTLWYRWTKALDTNSDLRCMYSFEYAQYCQCLFSTIFDNDHLASRHRKNVIGKSDFKRDKV